MEYIFEKIIQANSFLTQIQFDFIFDFIKNVDIQNLLNWQAGCHHLKKVSVDNRESLNQNLGKLLRQKICDYFKDTNNEYLLIKRDIKVLYNLL